MITSTVKSKSERYKASLGFSEEHLKKVTIEVVISNGSKFIFYPFVENKNFTLPIDIFIHSYWSIFYTVNLIQLYLQAHLQFAPAEATPEIAKELARLELKRK